MIGSLRPGAIARQMRIKPTDPDEVAPCYVRGLDREWPVPNRIGGFAADTI